MTTTGPSPGETVETLPDERLTFWVSWPAVTATSPRTPLSAVARWTVDAFGSAVGQTTEALVSAVRLGAWVVGPASPGRTSSTATTVRTGRTTASTVVTSTARRR